MALLRFRPSPPMIVGLVALFFAIGGSAFAIGQKIVPQARCANGSVRGFAVVTGDPTKGLANLPETYVSGPTYMKASFNCTGKGVQVRRQGQVFYILFRGNTGKVAVANVITGTNPGRWQSKAPPPTGRSRSPSPRRTSPAGSGTTSPGRSSSPNRTANPLAAVRPRGTPASGASPSAARRARGRSAARS